MKITFELVFIIVVVIAIILLLFIYNKNSKKIKRKEIESKKNKAISKTEVVVDKKQEVSASDFSESRLKEDNYLHKIFSKDDDGLKDSNAGKHTPRKSTVDDLLELDIDFEEGVFSDADFERMFDDDNFDDDYDVGTSRSAKKAKSELSEEFQNLSEDMKKLIITNVLNDKKSDE